MRVDVWNHQETREWSDEKSQLTTWVKPSAPFIMGSIANTKPLFRLVNCTILALPWSLTECPDAVSDESLDGFKVLDSRSSFFLVWRVMNSKDVLTRWWLGVSSQVESEKGLRKRSAEGRGALVEWKVKAARPGAKLKGPERVLAHILIFSESKRLQTAGGSLGAFTWSIVIGLKVQSDWKCSM